MANIVKRVKKFDLSKFYEGWEGSYFEYTALKRQDVIYIQKLNQEIEKADAFEEKSKIQDDMYSFLGGKIVGGQLKNQEGGFTPIKEVELDEWIDEEIAGEFILQLSNADKKVKEEIKK